MRHLMQDTWQAIIGRLVAWMIGTTTLIWTNIHPVTRVLAILMLADILLALIPAAKNGRISSRIAACGIAKKVGVLILVGLAEVLDNMLSMHNTLAPTCAGFYIAFVELPSILENCHRIGIPFPPGFRAWFEQMGGDDGGDEDTKKNDKDSRRGRRNDKAQETQAGNHNNQ